MFRLSDQPRLYISSIFRSFITIRPSQSKLLDDTKLNNGHTLCWTHVLWSTPPSLLSKFLLRRISRPVDVLHEDEGDSRRRHWTFSRWTRKIAVTAVPSWERLDGWQHGERASCDCNNITNNPGQGPVCASFDIVRSFSWNVGPCVSMFVCVCARSRAWLYKDVFFRASVHFSCLKVFLFKFFSVYGHLCCPNLVNDAL